MTQEPKRIHSSARSKKSFIWSCKAKNLFFTNHKGVIYDYRLHYFKYKVIIYSEENKWKYMFMYIRVFMKCNINDKKNLECTCTNEYTWKTYSSIRVFNFTMFAYWIIFHRYKAIKQSNILQMVAFRAVKFTDVRWLTKPREILQHSSENPEFVRNFMSQYILYLCALNMGMVQNNYKINNYWVLTVYNGFFNSVIYTCFHTYILYIVFQIYQILVRVTQKDLQAYIFDWENK